MSAPAAGPAPDGRPRLFVSVGTDHHPFDRLVGWVAEFARTHPDWDVALQHGRTPAPVGVPTVSAFTFCDHAQLLSLFADSTVVVSHGGPATITEARRTGHVPVVVPRDPTLGEHVDGHQQLFAARLAAAGLVTLAGSGDALAAAVLAQAQQRAATGASATLGAVPASVPPGVHVVGRIAEELARTARVRRGRSGARR